MPSITSWTRVESVTRASDLKRGLEARLADPLWLLARQWQLGELTGEDAGSPVTAEVLVESSPVTRFYPDVLSRGQRAAGRPYDPRGTPLEPLIERERPGARGGGLRRAAEAGIQLLRLLELYGAGDHRASLCAAHPLPPPIDAESAGFAQVVLGRVPDGLRIRAALARSNPTLDPKRLEPPAPLPATGSVREALLAWAKWFAEVIGDPSQPDSEAWSSSWASHRFSIAAVVPTAIAPDGEVVLVAPRYGGDLEWYAFDMLEPSSGSSLGAMTPGAVEAPTRKLIETLPVPLRYPGMPALRFWEFEDARVDLGAVAVAAGDLGRLILLELALIYGDDWFLIPVPLPAGALHHVARLRVRDTFGESTAIGPIGEGMPTEQRFRMFRCTVPDTDDTVPLLFLPPSLGEASESAPVEDVTFLRDELANLSWAVEHLVASDAGGPIGRGGSRVPAVPFSPEGSGKAAYRLLNQVPDGWYPLLRDPKDPIMLRLGRVLDEAGMVAPAPRGDLLSRGSGLLADLVTRRGLRMTRTYQSGRWIDGSAHVWLGRSVHPGAGESAVDLGADEMYSIP